MENKKKAKQKQRFDTDEKGKRIAYHMDTLESKWNCDSYINHLYLQVRIVYYTVI